MMHACSSLCFFFVCVWQQVQLPVCGLTHWFAITLSLHRDESAVSGDQRVSPPVHEAELL